MTFEPVYEVTEYHDGPRTGVASFNGVRFSFKSRLLDATEYRGDFESVDIFELVPLRENGVAQAYLATGDFRAVAGQPKAPPGQIGKLEVAWQVVGEFEVQLADKADDPASDGASGLT